MMITLLLNFTLTLSSVAPHQIDESHCQPCIFLRRLQPDGYRFQMGTFCFCYKEGESSITEERKFPQKSQRKNRVDKCETSNVTEFVELSRRKQKDN
eukprot:UN21890